MAIAVFRTDASPTIGAGHLLRCMALAEQLAGRGWRCTFLGTPETVTAAAQSAMSAAFAFIAMNGATPVGAVLRDIGPVDALVVDHYKLDCTFESGHRGTARAIVVIDDLADRPHDCDVLIDQSLGRFVPDYAPLVPTGARLLLGPQYALLRPQFAALRPAALARRGAAAPLRVFVSFGATDAQDVSSRAVRTLGGMADVAVDVALSSQAPHLAPLRALVAQYENVRLHVDSADYAALMASADLGMMAGGVTTWERCVVGLPAIVVITADNQRMQTRATEDSGAALIAGWHADVSEQDLRRLFLQLRDDPARLHGMAMNSAALCDGAGTGRVADVIEACLN